MSIISQNCDNRRNMAKLCRVCQKQPADRGGVCDICRWRILKPPTALGRGGRWWILAGFLVCIFAIASGLIGAALVTAYPASVKSPVIYEMTLETEQVTRKVYAYSMVPGGAVSLDEAKRGMVEPAMKASFANIDVAELRQVKLTTNLSGYVSYRSGGRIFWTSKMLTLRAGETIFTDGVHVVRGSCLNYFSLQPMSPVKENEPSEQVLDTAAEVPVVAYSFRVDTMELTPAVPIFPGAGEGRLPIFPIIPPIQRVYRGER
jgi:hypothetical protein